MGWNIKLKFIIKKIVFISKNIAVLFIFDIIEFYSQNITIKYSSSQIENFGSYYLGPDEYATPFTYSLYELPKQKILFIFHDTYLQQYKCWWIWVKNSLIAIDHEELIKQEQGFSSF